MEKRKIFGLILGIVFLMSLFSSFSSAYGSGLNLGGISQNVVDSYIQFFEPVLQALFGGFGWNGMYLFERLLLFVMLVSLVHLILGRVPLFEKQKTVKWVVAVIVPLIGIRFIDYEWLVTILNQYAILAIVLTSILPFVIYFFFLYNVAGDHGIMRKIGWLIFAGIYIGLWSEASGESSGQIYIWTFIAALVCLFGDNIINRRLRALELMKSDRHYKMREAGNLNMEIREIERQIAAGALDRKTGEEAIKKLTSHRKWLLRQ